MSVPRRTSKSSRCRVPTSMGACFGLDAHGQPATCGRKASFSAFHDYRRQRGHKMLQLALVRAVNAQLRANDVPPAAANASLSHPQPSILAKAAVKRQLRAFLLHDDGWTADS